jgi:hypothetical protein
MALIRKSIDEETTELADIYDSLIAPKKIWRSHNNKLYLALRSFSAGKVGLTDAAIALRSRFNPLYCEDIDLYSAAKLVGTDLKQGTGSMVRITIFNKDTTRQKVLRGGDYNYRSVPGTVFWFQVQNDYVFDPEEERIVFAISEEKGSFPVLRNTDIKLFRTDGAEIDPMFSFSCEDNSGQLGYKDETLYDFRARILTDADRQDHLKELELKIRNLPSILECNLIFNADTLPQEYDGITLAGKELLITITGVPTDKIAELVVKEVLYITHMVDPDNVIYYRNELYINGKYPVYFRYHAAFDFSLAIAYQYDKDKLKPVQVEDAVKALFRPYRQMATHLDIFSEGDAYRILGNLNLPNVKILDAGIINSDGKEVSFICVPKTRLPNLTDIQFTAVEIGGRM